jgi:hypothetical protein
MTYLEKLKQWRLEEVLLHPSLVGLAPVIEKCCSNDKTDFRVVGCQGYKPNLRVVKIMYKPNLVSATLRRTTCI